MRPVPRVSYAQPDDSFLTRTLISTIEVLFGRRRVEKKYRATKNMQVPAADFFGEALKQSRIDVAWHGFDLSQTPDGPLVIVANHPFGVVDGLIICDLAARLRGNFKVLLHSGLCQDADLMPFFLPIDFGNTKAAISNNIKVKKVAKQSLRDGIPVVIFPAGMVATATEKFGFGQVQEYPWTKFAARLIQETQATALPVFFSGRNSRKFHLASKVAEPLRMALLIREALEKFGTTIDAVVGDPMPHYKLASFESRTALTEFLRQTVLQLERQLTR